MDSQSENDLPPLDDLDELDRLRAADMLDNRPLYRSVAAVILPSQSYFLERQQHE